MSFNEMKPAGHHDLELWNLLIDGDEEAYSGLFCKYYPVLISYGKSLTSRHVLVPDCVQEVFIEIWIYRKNLAVPSSVKAYLLSSIRKRIARRLERDHIFRHTREFADLEFSVNFNVLDEMITDEEARSQVYQLNKLLNQLPERQKEALYLRYHQELEIEQIAELMQINPQSVSNLLHRAIKHLKTLTGEFPYLLLLLISFLS